MASVKLPTIADAPMPPRAPASARIGQTKSRHWIEAADNPSWQRNVSETEFMSGRTRLCAVSHSPRPGRVSEAIQDRAKKLIRWGLDASSEMPKHVRCPPRPPSMYTQDTAGGEQDACMPQSSALGDNRTIYSPHPDARHAGKDHTTPSKKLIRWCQDTSFSDA